MPFDRVIQDSDDEDELLGEIPPEKTNRAVTNYGEHSGANSSGAQEVNDDSHIAVDFDEYIEPQNVLQRSLTSSQQRREERWIPVTGRVGSMGMEHIIPLFSQLFAIGTRSLHMSHMWAFAFLAIAANGTQFMNRQHDDGNWHCATTIVRR